VALDTSGNLFASDAANHRVLQYTSPISSSQAALIVIGQSDFTTNTPNTGGISARTLNIPLGVIVDAIGNLWIADGANHRVLGHADLTDTDLDGIADVDDNCINTPNPNQLDMDGDGVGDLCDVVNIITSDVTLSVNTISLGNVIVQNNAVLTIEGITLDINLGTFSLTVKSGGGVLIKSGGTIT